MDTIFAPATVVGRAGVSVVRISGPHAHAGAMQLCGTLPPPRSTALRKIRTRAGELIDVGLVLYFECGGSFTGEDVVEFQLHGSVAVVNAVLQELEAIDGFRMAEPGEFTRRALENECLDLAQVEGLADLIDSETEIQRRQALRAFSGEMREKSGNWRWRLIRAMSLLEVTIDFSDEDVPDSVEGEVRELCHTVLTELRAELDESHTAERIREGFEVAIVGRPNVGKSTLLNSLAGREAAITSEHEGTTRDIIEVRMDLDGLPVTFLDTAGMREAVDPVERIGVARSMSRVEDSDLRVFLVEEFDEVSALFLRDNDIVVRGKADLYGEREGAVSGVTGEGVKDLLTRITEVLSQRCAGAGVVTRERHRRSLRSAIGALQRLIDGIDEEGAAAEKLVEELRFAVSSLDVLVGKIDVEAVLDDIFSGFCIGK